MPGRPRGPEETARWIATVLVSLVQYVVLGLAMFIMPQYCKTELHTSALSGRRWLDELLTGHPDRIYIALGMRRHVFLALVLVLRTMGHIESQNAHILLDESLAIFLYTCVTGLAIDHVAERFQHSHTTISEHFRKMLDILSGQEFYTTYVKLPSVDDPPPDAIRHNPRWWPYFKNVLGAIDGTHINCTPSAQDVHLARNRKGGVTQNCLAAVSFNMRFLFFTGGWDGCAADATMYAKARLKDFPVPAGKCYLADAGFGICDALLVPYRQVRYHLAEWARANQRPANFKELYNLRHASARNVVERIFGVVKHRWTILARAPHYDMETQAQIPSALVALHNFILNHDESDLDRWIVDEGAEDLLPGARRIHPVDFGRLSLSDRVQSAERRRAEDTRDRMAHAMWTDYERILEERMEVDSHYDDIVPAELD